MNPTARLLVVCAVGIVFIGGVLYKISGGQYLGAPVAALIVILALLQKIRRIQK